jgi:hypothetical protein
VTDDDQLVSAFIPPLVAVLLAAERAAGRPLTESEVLEIRDGATCIAVRPAALAAMAAERGYDDLDPERAWEQWTDARRELLG